MLYVSWRKKIIQRIALLIQAAHVVLLKFIAIIKNAMRFGVMSMTNAAGAKTLQRNARDF
mgnify:FL=1